MKTTLLVCFVSCVSLAGCVHTSEIGYETAQIMPEEAFRSVRRQDVLVQLKEEEKVYGMALSVTPDTLLLQEDGSNAILRLPMNRVESIEVAGDLFGPLVGFFGGCVVGGAIGALIGSTVDLESDSGV